MRSGANSNPGPRAAGLPHRTIPFTKPTFTDREADYVRQVIESGQLVGGGRFTEACQAWLESNTGCGQVLLTTSCTSALEIAALLAKELCVEPEAFKRDVQGGEVQLL